MKHYPEWRLRYNTAHYNYTCQRAPNVVRDGFYTGPTLPKVATANGLTQFICNFINWSGYRATRINTMGRQINGKFIPSATRKGTADISATIRDKNGIGRSIMIEIKCGNDKASQYQLDEQKKERQAGGVYEFISTPQQFFDLFDLIVS
jgi:hypothetical protein